MMGEECNPKKKHLHEGMQYSWCRCGLSKNGPFCDGSHKSTGIRPMLFTAEKDGEAELCTCLKTSTPPYCDKSRRNRH